MASMAGRNSQLVVPDDWNFGVIRRRDRCFLMQLYLMAPAEGPTEAGTHLHRGISPASAFRGSRALLLALVQLETGLNVRRQLRDSTCAFWARLSGMG